MDKKARILVVEDERLIAGMLKELLEANHYEVLLAGDGEDGLQKARSAQPDLILLDIMLPKLDGLKICRLLKFDLNYRHIPIIMLTARAGETDRQISLQSGANDYMVKPFQPQGLLTKISELLAGKGSSSLSRGGGTS
ncbi:MAG: response regulator [candidate division NC10 bacterium]|nr:response regulator [candidate division NC10 bacterium]